MKVVVVGAGIAGVMLAWRLRTAAPEAEVDLFADPRIGDDDATGSSGGLVRAFELEPSACRAAAQSLAELRSDPRLREWADYREIGSLYLAAGDTDPGPSLTVLDEFCPGAVELLAKAAISRRFPVHGLPAGTWAVLERQAGFLSPRRLRSQVLARLVEDGVRVHRRRVRRIDADSRMVQAEGGDCPFDAVVVAAGAWSPTLLSASGLPDQGLRTKEICYLLGHADLGGLGAFVDETSGLYGRPAGPGQVLLGLPGGRWDRPPGPAPGPDLSTARFAEEVVAAVADRLRLAVTPGPVVRSADCYHPQPGLALRVVQAGSEVYSFTAGSGGAAKTVIALSRSAAAELVAG